MSFILFHQLLFVSSDNFRLELNKSPNLQNCILNPNERRARDPSTVAFLPRACEYRHLDEKESRKGNPLTCVDLYLSTMMMMIIHNRLKRNSPQTKASHPPNSSIILSLTCPHHTHLTCNSLCLSLCLAQKDTYLGILPTPPPLPPKPTSPPRTRAQTGDAARVPKHRLT